ncbi:MAG: bacterial regulatory s, tetR family protein [Caulobacter sp.]|nr:bacterial regulatory s, tetR family protein [Caulobacter sp.]
MARPREFDRDVALDRAMNVFWDRGFAATSLDDLLGAMKIGRQSLYDAFGDKRRLYLEALAHYQRGSIAGHLERLKSAASPLAGIEAMLLGLIPDEAGLQAKGCMGVNAICEFGADDPDLATLRAGSESVLHRALIAQLQAARSAGETLVSLDVEAAATLIETLMSGIRVGARAGASPEALRETAAFAVARLRAA